MTKFDNYVYFSIAEISLDLYYKTKFSTYVNYCRTISKSLESASLDNREMYEIIKIVTELKKIYNFDTNLSMKYITDYFKSDRFHDFQKCILIVRKEFPFSFG